MAQSVVFDRDKVIDAVKHGIRRDGVAYVTYYGFGYTQEIIYRSAEVEVSSNAECEAIRRFLTATDSDVSSIIILQAAGR